MNKTHLQKECATVNAEIAKITKLLRSLPKENLICARNGKYTKWYVCTKGKNEYIKKKDRDRASKLALSKYYSTMLAELQARKEILAFSQARLNEIKATSTDYLSLDSPYRELLVGALLPLSAELENWKKAPYNKSTAYPEQLTQPSVTGNILRSKSEALIDLLLSQHNIPYRYECELVLNGISFHPDFTTRHPVTGQTIYWEHLGKMDDPGYVESSLNKLKILIRNGLIPGYNLIITCETGDHPLTPEIVEKVIQHYFFS